MSKSSLGGGINFTDAGSIYLSLLLMSSAARHLVAFCLGHIPRMESSIEGYDASRFSTDCKMVFTIISASLELPVYILFVPAEKMTFPGLTGNPPWSIRHFTCCTLSPPIPRFSQFGNVFSENGWRSGQRASRSIVESPTRQCCLVGLEPAIQCASNLSPQRWSGLERLVW